MILVNVVRSNICSTQLIWFNLETHKDDSFCLCLLKVKCEPRKIPRSFTSVSGSWLLPIKLTLGTVSSCWSSRRVRLQTFWFSLDLSRDCIIMFVMLFINITNAIFNRERAILWIILKTSLLLVLTWVFGSRIRVLYVLTLHVYSHQWKDSGHSNRLRDAKSKKRQYREVQIWNGWILSTILQEKEKLE